MAASPQDEQLTKDWEGSKLTRSITHEEHLRIARVLIRRHGRVEGSRRLVEGTRRNCELAGAAERFDEDLTRRWSERIADALEARDPDSFEAFIQLNPELTQSDLMGAPAWKQREID